jgi:hypothetical protein
MLDSSRRQLLLRMLGEFTVIVVGVLVALQLEAWRDRSAEAGRESEQLSALHSDFMANRARYAATIDDQRRMLEHSEALLSVMGRQAAVPPDSMGSLLGYGALSWYEVEPVTGAYDALIASGDIGLIQDAELRRELAEFFAELQAGFEDHENLMDILAEMQRRSAPWIVGIAPERAGFEYAAAPSDSIGVVRAVLSDDVFRGLLLLKVRLEMNRLEWHEAGADAVEEVLGLIESRLDVGERGAL